MNSRYITLIAIAVVGVSLTAGVSAGSARHTASSGITVVLSSDITGLDQTVDETLITSNIDANIYDRLITYTRHMTFKPMLATSWKHLKRNVWQFKLRKGVKFTNGEPFNAKAVKYSIVRSQAASSAVSYATANVAKVKIVNKYKVNVYTKHPDAVLLKNVGIYLDMVPPKAGRSKNFASHPIGTGPYMFKKWDKGQEIALRKNAHYWGGKVSIPSVTYRFVSEDSTRLGMLLAKQADIVMNLNPQDGAAVKGHGGSKIESVPSVNKMLVIPDPSVAPLAKAGVRKALNYAVNKNAIVKNLMSGYAVKSMSAAVTVAQGYDGSLKNYYDPNIAKAKALLASAGYPNGFNVPLYHTNGVFPGDTQIASAIANNLSKIGVHVNLQAVTYQNLAGMLRNKTFGGLALMRYGDYLGDISSLMTFALWSGGTSVFVHSAKTDKELGKAVTLFGKSRIKAFNRIDKQLTKNVVPWIYLFDFKNIYGVNNRLSWKPTPYIFMDLRGAHLK
jgi:peptide/nickel transport system substrate-binding protein